MPITAPYHPPAVIEVDGREFIRCTAGEPFYAMFDATIDVCGGDVVLWRWRPARQAYERAAMSRSEPVAFAALAGATSGVDG
jgi:hypothetical protein